MGINTFIKKAKKSIFQGFHADGIMHTNNYAQTSYAQEGEDLILERLLGDRESGFYIDVGAHHPLRFSNTYRFYLKGWRGINIDAMPGSMALFNTWRPHDINLELPISENEQELKFYLFNEPALNTFSESEAKLKDGKYGYKITGHTHLTTATLQQVLTNHLPKNITAIDFMSIDVEGHDLQVLKSNNWIAYRPRIVLVEILRTSLREMLEHEICIFMQSQGYKLAASSVQTAFFIDQNDK